MCKRQTAISHRKSFRWMLVWEWMEFPALALWDVVIESLHSSKNTHQAVRDHCRAGNCSQSRRHRKIEAVFFFLPELILHNILWKGIPGRWRRDGNRPLRGGARCWHWSRRDTAKACPRPMLLLTAEAIFAKRRFLSQDSLDVRRSWESLLITHTHVPIDSDAVRSVMQYARCGHSPGLLLQVCTEQRYYKVWLLQSRIVL